MFKSVVQLVVNYVGVLDDVKSFAHLPTQYSNWFLLLSRPMGLN